MILSVRKGEAWDKVEFASALGKMRGVSAPSRARREIFWRAGRPRFDKFSCAISANLSRLAARLSRRRCTRTSSTMPVWSTARQPVFHTGDFEHDLIQMPFVAGPREPTADPVRKLLAKFARPLPYGFVADDDAASGQQLLHHAKTEREAEIQPYGMADDLGGEPIPGVAVASACGHPTRLLTSIRPRKPAGSTKLTVPAL